jgi:hypothetical protein
LPMAVSTPCVGTWCDLRRYKINVVPPAGLPKDGTWCDQRFSTGTLVIEAGFDLSLIG